jgi:hypothetical protein
VNQEFIDDKMDLLNYAFTQARDKFSTKWLTTEGFASNLE